MRGIASLGTPCKFGRHCPGRRPPRLPVPATPGAKVTVVTNGGNTAAAELLVGQRTIGSVIVSRYSVDRDVGPATRRAPGPLPLPRSACATRGEAVQ
jgi:hypothetical protein